MISSSQVKLEPCCCAGTVGTAWFEAQAKQMQLLAAMCRVSGPQGGCRAWKPLRMATDNTGTGLDGCKFLRGWIDTPEKGLVW